MSLNTSKPCEISSKCPLHSLPKAVIDILAENLTCIQCRQSCQIPNKEFFEFSDHLSDNFSFFSILDKNNSSFDLLCQLKSNNQVFQMKLYLKTVQSSVLNLLKRELNSKFLNFSHENLQTVHLFRQDAEFYVLSEFFYEKIPLNPQNANFYLRQVLEGLSYLHNSSLYHGNLTWKSLKLEKNTVKLCYSSFPVGTLVPDAIFVHQRKDLRNFGLLLYQFASGQCFSMENEEFLEGKSKEISENLIKNNNYGVILGLCLEGIEIQNIRMLFMDLNDNEKPIFSLKNSKKKHEKITVCPLQSCYKIDQNSVKLEIIDKQALLRFHFDVLGVDFQILAKNMLKSDNTQKIKSLKVNLRPNFSLVSPQDDWRKFWWYGFYNQKAEKYEKNEIALNVHSTDDWDNGLPTSSINAVIDILKQGSFKSHEFKRLDLRFHSYLHIKDKEIKRIANIIKKYNFSRLKHFEIVVSAEQGKKESFLRLLTEFHKRVSEIEEKLQTFSVLFNCINDANPCVGKIGEIAKKLKNLKVFRFWFGNVNKNMDIKPLNEAFSISFLSKLKILGIGFNSWKEKPHITDCNFLELLDKMKKGLSKNLQEINIWLWRLKIHKKLIMSFFNSCDIMEQSKIKLFDFLRQESLIFHSLNLYFEGWAVKVETQEIMQEEVKNYVKNKIKSVGMRANHIKLYLKT